MPRRPASSPPVRSLVMPAAAAALAACATARAPASSQVATGVAREAAAAAERAVLAADSAVDRAWERGDRVALDSLLADSFLDTDASGPTTPKRELLAGLGTPVPFASTTTQEDVRVAAYGDAAVLTARKVFHLRLGDQRATRPQRVTNVYVRQGGRWWQATSHQSDVPPERVAVRVDPSLYDAYAGVYDLGGGQTLTVTREGDRLMAQGTGFPKVEYVPLSATEFFVRDWPAQHSAVFVRDASGAVVANVRRMYGLEQTRRRLGPAGAVLGAGAQSREFPVGRYAAVVEGAERSAPGEDGNAGSWDIELSGSGATRAYRVLNSGQLVGTGTVTLAGTRATVADNSDACSGFGDGTYTWAATADTLRFTEVGDACDPRRTVLVGRAWRRRP